MSVSAAIDPQMPYLRRFARALTGNQSSGFVIPPPVEGKGIFAEIFVNQVAFPEGAAGYKLDGIHPAHVGFNHSHDFFVSGLAHFL